MRTIITLLFLAVLLPGCQSGGECEVAVGHGKASLPNAQAAAVAGDPYEIYIHYHRDR